jgi:hypothetical protein
MSMRQHPHSKQSPVGAFRIDDATLVHGRVDLGWYEVFPNGTLRGPVQSEPNVAPPHRHQRPVLRHIRTPAIRARHVQLTLYGQIK